MLLVPYILDNFVTNSFQNFCLRPSLLHGVKLWIENRTARLMLILFKFAPPLDHEAWLFSLLGEAY